MPGPEGPALALEDPGEQLVVLQPQRLDAGDQPLEGERQRVADDEDDDGTHDARHAALREPRRALPDHQPERGVGHPERGEALADKLQRAENDLKAVALKPPRTAIVLQREGYTEGTESLVASMLATAGLKPPPNARGGIGGFMDMETLLTAGPDILALQETASHASDQGALFLTHPALRARYDETRRISLPSRYTLCGGPALLEGLGVLKDELKKLR